jgi:glycine cleavage system H protein
MSEPTAEQPRSVVETATHISYTRCKFQSNLPKSYRYTPSHFWLARQGDTDVWRVGFTKFASRMLGELVEYGFKVAAGERVELGQPIGWFEGLKAVSELYAPMDGEFVRANAELENHETWTRTDPYGNGWLYEIRGTPDEHAVDVHGYIAVLDATIDKMQED